jgi:hypothetical protein
MMVYGDLTWKREGLILGSADFLINYVLPFVAIILFYPCFLLSNATQIIPIINIAIAGI